MGRYKTARAVCFIVSPYIYIGELENRETEKAW